MVRPTFKATIEQLLDTEANLSYDEVGKLVFKPILTHGLTHKELMCVQLISQACGGCLDAIRIVLDRIDGKPIQRSVNAELSGSYVDFLKEMGAEIQEDLAEL